MVNPFPQTSFERKSKLVMLSLYDFHVAVPTFYYVLVNFKLSVIFIKWRLIIDLLNGQDKSKKIRTYFAGGLFYCMEIVRCTSNESTTKFKMLYIQTIYVCFSQHAYECMVM